MLTSNNLTMSFKRRPSARMRLFCLPYAGAGASVYRDWHTAIRDDVEVVGIQLPGRENRFSEPHLTSIDDVVDKLIRVINAYSDKPFVLFGHSLGALISFELTRALQRLRLLAPRHLFVSGTCAPQRRRVEDPIHLLPDDAFLEEIRRFNGTPKSLLQDDELMKLFIPLLRADFRVAEAYRYEDRGPIRCPVTALGGDGDDGVSPEDLNAWSELCHSSFDQHLFQGDHFFIHNNRPAIIDLVNSVLDGLLSASAVSADTSAEAQAIIPTRLLEKDKDSAEAATRKISAEQGSI